MDIGSRHHLRSDAVRDLRAAIEEQLGVTVDADTYEHVELDGSDIDLVLCDGAPHACYIDDEPFLTVRGANAYPPERRVVTVDAGAVEFVSDGADVMRPGIEAADERIAAGELVVIAEAAHGKALAVGRARTEGAAMIGEQGKVVDSIHHVGDELYAFQP
jgi:PUA domain protein